MLFFRKTTLLALLALAATSASAQFTVGSFSDNSSVRSEDNGSTWNDVQAYIRHDQVDILWYTISEKNIDRFEIERSQNGTDYEYLSTVYGSGTSSDRLNYSSTDVRPLNGSNYYRIKQIDFEGNITVSSVMEVKIQKEKKSQLKLVPNPTGPGSVVELEASGLESNAPFIVEMRTDRGEVVVYDHRISDAEGRIRAQMSVSMRQGLYIVTVAGENGGVSTQLIVR